MIGKTNCKEEIIKQNIDDNTLFLLADTIEDKSNYHHQIKNHNVIISNTQTRDNRNSLYFNSANAASLIILNKYYEFHYGTNDWTIEYWFYPLTNAGYVYHSQRQPGTAYGILVGGRDTATNRGFWLTNATNNGWTISGKVLANSDLSNQWIHYALVRYNNNVLAFCNGTLISTTAYTISIPRPETAPIIGGYWSNTDSNSTAFPPNTINGYLQDFRISNIARYTATFTPPARFLH